jgi:hypothetical protein
MKKKNVIGKKFNNWIILDYAERRFSGNYVEEISYGKKKN